MVKQVKEIALSKEEALISAVDTFLDYAWDKGMQRTNRLMMLLMEGFVSSELSDAVGTLERGDAVSTWVKVMQLLESFAEYKEGTQTIRVIVTRD